MLNRKRVRWLLRELTRPLWHEELVRLKQLEMWQQYQGTQTWVTGTPPHPIHVDPRALHPYRGPIHVDPHAWPNEWQVRQKLGPGLSV